MSKSKGTYFRVKIGIILTFVLLNFILIFIKKHPSLDLTVLPNTHATPAIYADNVVGQTFIAKEDHLCQIDVMLGTYGRKNDQEVILQVWEMFPKKSLAAQNIVNAVEMRDNLFHSFKFNPVSGSEGKEYYFELQSALSTERNSICVWINKQNIYPEGEYFFCGKKAEGDLIFRTYSKKTIITELSRIVKNNSGIMASLGFLVLVIILFFIIQVYFLLLLLKWLGKILRLENNQSE